MAFVIVEFESLEVDYLPWLWISSSIKIDDVSKHIENKSLTECHWPPAYVKNITKAKDMLLKPSDDWSKYEARILGIAGMFLFIFKKYL